MVDPFTRFVRSNAVYSKTTGLVHVAQHEDDIFVFINGLPLRHINFLHYAIQAVHPGVERPHHVAETMNEEAFDLLPRLGLEFEDATAAGFYACKHLRDHMKVDRDDEAYRLAVFKLLDEIDEQVRTLDPLFSVGNLDDNVISY